MTPDQEELLGRARESIAAARLLLEGGFPGFAASRAYYAMFYLTQAVLEGEGLAFSKHSAVIAAFGKYLVKPGRISAEYHRYLLDALEARHEGDYSPVSSITIETAKEHLKRAEKFLTLVESFLQ
ncbi:MAG: HEPN domain-containing protein [Desulfobaccales bacterium]